jgi:hypothetical protein
MTTKRRPLNRAKHSRAEFRAWEVYMMLGTDWFHDLDRAGYTPEDIKREAPRVWRRHGDRFIAHWRSENWGEGLPTGETPATKRRLTSARRRKMTPKPSRRSAWVRLEVGREYGGTRNMPRRRQLRRGSSATAARRRCSRSTVTASGPASFGGSLRRQWEGLSKNGLAGRGSSGLSLSGLPGVEMGCFFFGNLCHVPTQ